MEVIGLGGLVWLGGQDVEVCNHVREVWKTGLKFRGLPDAGHAAERRANPPRKTQGLCRP